MARRVVFEGVVIPPVNKPKANIPNKPIGNKPNANEPIRNKPYGNKPTANKPNNPPIGINPMRIGGWVRRDRTHQVVIAEALQMERHP